MAIQDEVNVDYPEDVTERLELIWGEGFLSPGGPAEVSRIVGDKDLVGCDVLDIGSGSGGADVVLLRDHGAASVVGIDVEQYLVDLSRERIQKLHLEDRITYQLVDPGVLPFADESFDFVFSKDTIVHIRDKEGLFSETLRILRPGGWLLVGDWLRGEGETFTPTVERFIAASGYDFTLISLQQTGEIVKKVGFKEIELVDRGPWYLREATAELQRLRGPLNSQFMERWGKEAIQEETEFWEVLVASLNEGAVRPGHVRAMKPSTKP